MKKLLIAVYSAFLLILIANFIYYWNLYNKQITYITTLLDSQARIVGLAVDDVNNNFTSDLTKISNPAELSMFFDDPAIQTRVEENMKLFYSKYQDLITAVKLFDNRRNEYTLKKDEDTWLPQKFITNVQSEIVYPENLYYENKRYSYYLPLMKDNVAIGNMVVTIDYQKYFDAIFSVFNLKDYQWQWVVSDSGEVIYNNSADPGIMYSDIEKIEAAVQSGSYSNMRHTATINGRVNDLISSYYSTQLIGRELGLVFSSTTDFFQKYLIRNSVFIVIATLILVQLIIYFFLRHIKAEKAKQDKFEESDRLLNKLIDEMPAGVVIYNSTREVIKANNIAAKLYSFADESEMSGRVFPAPSVSDTGNYFSKNLGSSIDHDQFVILRKEEGDLVLFRNAIPVLFSGREATMELLIDVTTLESARKQEAMANVAKSEFLARMSYEIRTPLNGIIGMIDILSAHDIPGETITVVNLLRKSTEMLLNIITDILDFSKIETGKMMLDEIPFSIREELEHISGLTKTYIAGKNIAFSLNVDDNVPESIIADPYRLKQVLSNLISHSSSCTDKGEIKLNCRLAGSNSGIITLEFELLDTGASFSRENLDKIFGYYINIDSRLFKHTDESGFGTVLARQLIELMGGEFTAQSPSGLSGNSGTRVVFTIVAYSNDRMMKNLGQDLVKSFDHIRTLVITGPQSRDEDVISSLHKSGLNLSITTFQKSTVGQIKANVNIPEDKYELVVILDDREFNGIDAAASLWENGLSASYVIMIISSNDVKGNYLKSITMGVDHYLVLPVDENKIRDAVLISFPNIESPHRKFEASNLRTDIEILVVEDNKISQKVIDTMLKTLGYSCEIAENGLDAVSMAGEKKYDLIFMDLVLPDISGHETARQILAADRKVLIAAFTADNMPETRKKADLSGIREFIVKPVRIDDLKKLLERHFRKTI
ncbi:MAG: response regulator [Bacteroidales bacterium]|jgi:signal transduction histidine kinase/CheY-like chemotaxis protein|nr:response regulator [Bacteroidales bacterium]